MHKKRCPDCLGIGRAFEENRTELPPNQTAKMVDCPTCNGTGWKRKTKKDRLRAMQQTLNPTGEN